MFRPLRSMLSTSRLPYIIERRTQNSQAAHIARARFQPLPWKRRAKKVFIHGLAAYVAFQVWVAVLDPYIQKLEPPEEHDEDEDLPPLFLPILGTAKLLPPVRYAGTDPEWQAFVKFGADKTAAKRVRDELAAHVLKTASQLPALKDGKTMILRRAWLDIDFPHSFPPEYQRSGIEFSDDGVLRWTTRNVDANTIFKIRSVLYPKAVLQSAWAFIKVVTVDEFARVSTFLGFQSHPPPPTFEEFLQKHKPPARPAQIPSASGPPLQPVAGNSARPIGAGNSTDKSALAPAGDQRVVKTDLVAYFYRPILAMKHKFVTTWKPVQPFGPKGSLVVSGLVEVETTKVWVVFDVLAYYNPTDRTFDAKSMRLVPRRLQQKRQAPTGRPKPPPLPAAPPQAGKPY